MTNLRAMLAAMTWPERIDEANRQGLAPSELARLLGLTPSAVSVAQSRYGMKITARVPTGNRPGTPQAAKAVAAMAAARRSATPREPAPRTQRQAWLRTLSSEDRALYRKLRRMFGPAEAHRMAQEELKRRPAD